MDMLSEKYDDFVKASSYTGDLNLLDDLVNSVESYNEAIDARDWDLEEKEQLDCRAQDVLDQGLSRDSQEFRSLQDLMVLCDERVLKEREAIVKAYKVIFKAMDNLLGNKGLRGLFDLGSEDLGGFYFKVSHSYQMGEEDCDIELWYKDQNDKCHMLVQE